MSESRRRPNFFIIGAPKSGTTAMAHYLASHPGVCFADPKEPFYWAEDLPGLRELLGTPTLDDYLRCFDRVKAEQTAVGEGSTLYLFSEQAVPRILEFEPKARLIVMLRHPVELAHAFHMQMRFHFFEEEEDFETAWAMQDERQNGRGIPSRCSVPQLLQYRDVAALGRQMERLLRVARPEQVLTIFFDDFRCAPDAAYRQVLDFLRLPDDGRVNFPRINAAMTYRIGWLTRSLRSRPVTAVSRALKRQLTGRAYALADRTKKTLMMKRQPRPELPEPFRRRLVAEFRDDIQLLADRTGRNLCDWLE